MKKQKKDTLTGRRGQSLVELALFLPIFLIIIAGVVEVSQLVITQNRITDAARASSRFGANGGRSEDMATVIQGAVTDTLGWDESKWDIWIIHGMLDPAGTTFLPNTWEFTHEFGYSNTVRSADLDIDAIQAQIIEELQLDHKGQTEANIAGNLDIVGTYIIHDIESMLGFDSIPALSSINSVSELNVMRLATASGQQSTGCSAFPIAVSSGIRAIGGGNPYPNLADFEYPAIPPRFESFTYHIENGVVLNPEDPVPNPLPPVAKEGTLFKVSRGGFIYGNDFGWLKWNLGITGINGSALSGDAAVLSNSLSWPGDSNDYADHTDPGAPYGFEHIVRGYVKPGDTTAQALRKDEWVSVSPAQLPEISDAVDKLIDSGTGVRVIMFDTVDTSFPGTGGVYFIDQFAIFRIIGYGNSNQDNEWLLLEFIRLDDSCGERLSIE